MDQPPLIPPPLPSETAPSAKPPVLRVIILSVASVLLVLLNVFMSLLLMPRRVSAGSPSFQSGYVQGYVGGSIIIPAALILGVACIWKSNRRPLRLLVWFCATMAGLVAIRIPTLLSTLLKTN
jgi:hypothetical protein